MSSTPRRLTYDDYTIGCICPMGIEQAPVEAMLDEIHPDLSMSRDKNNYTLGRIYQHNVVIAAMPDIGNNSASSVANQLANDFPSIRFNLLIGVGGGIPNLDKGLDIRLGDVVVSKPSKEFGGVVQFDRGVDHTTHFQRTGVLQKPPDVLLATVGRLEARHRLVDSAIPQHLHEMLQKYPKMIRGGYHYQGAGSDCLFASDYQHQKGNDCGGCNPAEVIIRDARPDTDPVVHYGTIGSSNMVIGDSEHRDQLRRDLNIQCVEMEAAGLMDTFPGLIIRGICDYADSHKNKRWQPYAAAVAAAYARELLSLVPIVMKGPSVEDNEHPHTSQKNVVIHMANARNLVNGSVAGDVVAGDKFKGRYLCESGRDHPYEPDRRSIFKKSY